MNTENNNLSPEDLKQKLLNILTEMDQIDLNFKKEHYTILGDIDLFDVIYSKIRMAYTLADKIKNLKNV
ncbi:MAG: hypothetical protein WC438_05735 [Candidatus Pacearchaeota archaeon]|jgi:hypothetical protein